LSCYWHCLNFFATTNRPIINLLLIAIWNLLVVLIKLFNLFVVVGRIEISLNYCWHSWNFFELLLA
jgi:hypothetical protein